MNKSVRGILWLVSALVFSAVLAVGCGDGGGSSDGGNLVLPDGWVWAAKAKDIPIMGAEMGLREDTRVGLTFNIDGTITTYAEIVPGIWVDANNLISETEEAENMSMYSWTTSGGMLELTEEGEWWSTTISVSYSISGNTLTIRDRFITGMSMKFTKTQINLVDPAVDPELLDRTWIDGADASAWKFADPSDIGMNIPLPVGAALYVNLLTENMEAYAFFTNNNTIILVPVDLYTGEVDGEAISYAYSIAGDKLTINGKTYTETDINIGYLPKGKMPKVKASEARVPELSKALFNAMAR